MSVIVLVLGIAIAGAGVIAIGFGIPINDLSLGHTLITAGTTALAGGLILVGLAAAVAELTKIAEAVRPRAAGRAARAGDGKLKPEAPAPAPEVRVEPRAAEPRPVEVRPTEPRAAEPHPTEPRPAEPRPPEPRVAKPRPAADTTLEVSASAIERLRSSLPRNERPKNDVMTAAEEVPLSPNGGNGAHHPAEPAPPATKATNGAAQPDATVETMKGPRLDFLFRSKSTRPGQAESFDALWPKRPAKGGEMPKPPSGERPAVSERPPSREAPPPPVEAPPGPRADEPRSVGILKSGVVDGMAYTLYADGAIEAQLPQGTVRFGSIAELRAHIENNP